MPKKFKKFSFIIIAGLFTCFVFASGVAMASAQTDFSADTGRDPSSAATRPAAGTPAPLGESGSSETAPPQGSPISESFNVNKYLKDENQKSYVPKGAEAAGDKPTGIAQILLKATDIFVKIIASLSLLVFILGALITIVSEGKSDMLEKGKSAMLYSIIGLVLAMFSFIIVAFVQSILF